MIISHKYKFIFTHIPKCGGVSIYNIFNTPRRNQTHLMIRDQPVSLQKQVKKYFNFCFVRNPWSRFLSAYSYLRRGGRGSRGDLQGAKIINQFENLKEFSYNFDKIKNDFVDKHFYEQVYWIDDKVDFIGRFENLQQDFDIICDKIGIPHQQLPHTNKTKHKHYTEYYDDETREIVAEKYAKDIEMFGYEFGE
tara:strand:+ start:79048 stop:79626 length:579 start_codon:yes stop_codon:yes gene_type:complete